jgi:hypothetical protein
MSAIVESEDYKDRSQFRTYYLDYVVCDKKGMKPLLVIELDDRTHFRKKRIEQDQRKNNVLHEAKIPFVRYQAQKSYSITDVKKEIFPVFCGDGKPPQHQQPEHKTNMIASGKTSLTIETTVNQPIIAVPLKPAIPIEVPEAIPIQTNLIPVHINTIPVNPLTISYERPIEHYQKTKNDHASHDTGTQRKNKPVIHEILRTSENRRETVTQKQENNAFKPVEFRPGITGPPPIPKHYRKILLENQETTEKAAAKRFPGPRKKKTDWEGVLLQIFGTVTVLFCLAVFLMMSLKK